MVAATIRLVNNSCGALDAATAGDRFVRFAEKIGEDSLTHSAELNRYNAPSLLSHTSSSPGRSRRVR